MEIEGELMGTQEVITETQIKQRLLDLEEQNRKLQQELLEERKNTNFTQTYPKGWRGLETSYRAIQELLGCIPSYQNTSMATAEQL